MLKFIRGYHLKIIHKLFVKYRCVSEFNVVFQVLEALLLNLSILNPEVNLNTETFFLFVKPCQANFPGEHRFFPNDQPHVLEGTPYTAA